MNEGRCGFASALVFSNTILYVTINLYYIVENKDYKSLQSSLV